MGNIVDSNAMYRIGKSMAAEGVRDNRQRDAFMGFLGGQALNQLGKAFQTRKALKTAGSATVTNTKLSVDEGNYDENMLAIATDVINNGKANLNKGANMTAIGKTGKGTELINTTNAELKRLVSGMEHVKSKVDLWKDIYTTGNFTGKDGNTMKVSVNGASSAQSQDLAASFADGSIYQSMDFRDGKWGLVGEETIVGGIKNPTFTLLEDLKLPELDESKMINDYSKGLNADFEKLGYNNKTGNWSEYEETTKDNIFNDFQNMTENQISSKWFSENGNDKTTPALKYLMQEGGYSINGEQYDALLDPNEMNISADEQAQRQVLATGALEMLKLEDLDNYENDGGKINLGVGRITNSPIYKTQQEVNSKMAEINNAKLDEEVVVQGFEGSRTYRYRKVAGKDKWNYQVWNSQDQMFQTEEVGGKVLLSKQSVINDVGLPKSSATNSHG